LTAGKGAGHIELIGITSLFIANVKEEFFMTSPEEKTRITVDIYGNSYKLMASQTSTAYMKSVADLVNDQMFRIAKTFPRLDSQRIAVLASVNMADENLRLKERIEELNKGQQDSSKSQEKYDKLQMNHENLQMSYDKLLQNHGELKREHESNLKLMQEHAEKVDVVYQDMVKITEQNELLSEQISGLFLQTEKERELGNSAQEQLNQLQEQLRAQKEELLELTNAEKAALSEQFLADKEALLEKYLADKEELIDRHRREKEELMRQGGNQDEVLQQELAKVESEYRALQEEYGKLQNEYNEWIELAETDSLEK
jgi:cell division protein ZapA (FtsZ GTPase activity inhibitor)